MLWIVTQTETTLRTGDHSLPRIDAHIFGNSGSTGVARCGQDETHMAIGVYVLMVWSDRRDARGEGKELTGCIGAA